MIELIDFNKTYTTQKNSFCVKNINLKIVPGRITGLLGANGSGKTTIMKAICGFHYPTSGKIIISQSSQSYDIQENSQKALEFTGYVPEISMLPADFTVIDFLVYAGKNHNLKDKELENKIKELIKDFMLEDLLLKKIKKLSKGQQQRVSFAQALIHNPSNLILDEPFSGLDPSQIKQIRTIIKNLSKEKSILFSTHILQEAHSLCSDIFIMKDGIMFETENNLSLEQLEERFIDISEAKVL